MTNIEIIKDTDEQLMLSASDYVFTSDDTVVFKFAEKWGDNPIKTVSGAVNTSDNSCLFNLPSSMTENLEIEQSVGDYVYEIEGMLSGEKKVLLQGNLYIKNTI